MHYTIKIAIVGGLLSCSGAALAADYSPPLPRVEQPAYPPATYPPAAFPGAVNWSGFSLGGNIGAVSGHGTATGSLGGPYSYGQNFHGAVAGVQAGYNWQLGNTVLGLEDDIQWTSQSREFVLCPGCFAFATLKNEIPWFATFRGRAGYAIDRYLLYVTGGGAYIQLKSTLTGTAFGTSAELASWSDIRPAWTLGAGIEYKWLDGWEGRLEYLYLDTGSFEAGTTIAGLVTFSTTLHVTDHVARAAVNYRF